MAYTTIDKPTDYFNTKLYTGNGSTQSITGVGFQPDFVWYKERASTDYHTLQDVIRGVGKRIFSNVTEAEDTNTSTITSFDSDGFSVGNNSGTNQSGQTYVSWNWKAGGTASSNSDGSITSSVSANTTAGFSIVSYTGTGSTATIGHGLSSTPQVVLIKCRSDATNWHMYHSSVTTADNQVMYLDLNYALSTLTTSSFDVSEFSSSVFGLNTNDAVNGSGRTYIAYCFAEKKGFSKFGSYQGNSSADGTFVYTGFKPAWVVIKRTDTTGNWHMLDNKRDPINEADATLLANVSDVEFQSTNDVDFLSNGFKLRANQTSTNVGTYIYMAFAESPFVNSNGVPTNAR
jgi:hypothetical protein